jgi:ATP-dependent helicase/nuclease subunit A
VLVERYLHILRTQDVGVDQIVAITFTNRAANEMRERLRTELDKLLRSSIPNERAKWMRHKRTLEGAIITTIHGFCARLLREFPVEADIDPQFALLDAHQSAMLEEAVIEAIITELISARDQAITELAAGIGRARLASGLIDIYRSMRGQGLTVERLRALVAGSHATVEDYGRALEALSRKMEAFIGTAGLSPTAEDKRREASHRWPAFREALSNAPVSLSIAEFTDAVHRFRDKTRPTAHPKVRDLVKELDELIWKDKLGGLVPQTLFDLYASRYAAALIEAVGAIERRLDEEKRRGSALDFDDLQVRALTLLEEHPHVVSRIYGRYRFFLVDEFQDTNSLQRDLMARLALGATNLSLSGSTDFNLRTDDQQTNRLKSVLRTNLFIVGDRKQSIYGFRGADVDVFREMTAQIEVQNGLPVQLNRNFRSQRPLISFFNYLFDQVFARDELTSGLSELGYVEHEASVAARDDEDPTPLVELLIDIRENSGGENDEESPGDQPNADPQEKPRERDGYQLASRIAALVGAESITTDSGTRAIEYRDIALLFRAMTEVHIYEAALRREGIPYVTVDGKGFYAREEITDFIQLLRFLDNKTDEVALAAVLRSPICGLSDDTLMALRCPPQHRNKELPFPVSSEEPEPGWSSRVRPLLRALREHESIDTIDEAGRPALDGARRLLDAVIDRSKRSRVSELLRFAVEASEYRTVAAAHFDGAQRLSNIEKLFTLAQRFERSGAYMIRDFVRFVRDFEEAGGRESEGQIDDSADAVRLMSIHQSKGLEFPVVIIPDLHRLPDNRRAWWALDRHRGLTLKVPDGTGKVANGRAVTVFTERAKLREEFESMRLLYVAATRAQDRLILSGAVKDLSSIRSSWLSWICKAFGVGKDSTSGLLNPAEDVSMRVTLNLAGGAPEETRPVSGSQIEPDLPAPTDEAFPLLAPIEPELSGLHRFSVTQLLNYHRCPRQYYFDRVLHTPGEDEVGVWNDTDAPDPPSNLTATLRGAVIHRFCEVFREADVLADCLRQSFDYVLLQRAAQLGDRVAEIDPEKALHDLMPLAQNYLESSVRERIGLVRDFAQHSALSDRHSCPGVLSEQRFRIRRPLGILTGTIDKLVVRLGEDGASHIEIIDFKTNRFRGALHGTSVRKQITGREGQLAFGFLESPEEESPRVDLMMQAEIKAAAADYQVQMQAYVLAVRELFPEARTIKATLHFLHPNVEVSVEERLVERDSCAEAIDETMLRIVSSSSPKDFPPQPGERCRQCNFVEVCFAGMRWMTAASES